MHRLQAHHPLLRALSVLAGVDVKSAFLPTERRGGVEGVLLTYCERVGCTLVVTGSSELVKANASGEEGDSPLGSVALAIATRCPTSHVINKNYSAI